MIVAEPVCVSRFRAVVAVAVLLGLVPVAAWLVDRGPLVVVLSLVSVVLIAGSVYTMFRPATQRRGAGGG